VRGENGPEQQKSIWERGFLEKQHEKKKWMEQVEQLFAEKGGGRRWVGSGLHTSIKRKCVFKHKNNDQVWDKRKA